MSHNKEAHNHSFSHKVPTLLFDYPTPYLHPSRLQIGDGVYRHRLCNVHILNSHRAQFAKRDTVYSQAALVKQHDSFVIVCTITSSPSQPQQPPASPRQSVPKGLLDTVGALLDDPIYSDVEFILPRRGQSLRSARRIWASRRLLRRAEYFDTSERFLIYNQLANSCGCSV